MQTKLVGMKVHLTQAGMGMFEEMSAIATKPESERQLVEQKRLVQWPFGFPLFEADKEYEIFAHDANMVLLLDERGQWYWVPLTFIERRLRAQHAPTITEKPKLSLVLLEGGRKKDDTKRD